MREKSTWEGGGHERKDAIIYKKKETEIHDKTMFESNVERASSQNKYILR